MKLWADGTLATLATFGERMIGFPVRSAWLASLLTLCWLSPSVSARRIGGVEWLLDYASALDRAKHEKKLLWVHFGEDPG